MLAAILKALGLRRDVRLPSRNTPPFSHEFNPALLEEAEHAFALGRIQDAESICRQMLARAPNTPHAILLLAKIASLQRRTDDASRYFLELISYAPTWIDGFLGFAKFQKAQSKFDEAEDLFRRALSIDPCHPAANLEFGIFLALQKRRAESLQFLELASVGPTPLRSAHLHMASVLMEQGEWDSAEQELRTYIVFFPHDAKALARLAKCLEKKGGWESAEALYLSSTSLDPSLSEPWVQLGQLYRKQERSVEELTCSGKAAQLAPNQADILGNYGLALLRNGKAIDAISTLDQALAMDPGSDFARFNRALAYLLLGQFSNGWADYSARHQLASSRKFTPQAKAWDGSALAGHSMLIRAEQGIGDEIMFASCYPDILCQSENVIIECSAKLQPIFARSFPAACVFGRDSLVASQETSGLSADFEIAAGDIPKYLRPDIESFPCHQGYLQSDHGKSKRWHDRLTGLGSGLKVGISWRGGIPKTRQKIRSIELKQLQPILSIADCHFINLQYTDCREEIDRFRRETGLEIHSWQNALDDFDETAALVSALDLVISVCTSIVHLTGALGKPAWVLVPASPEWRYGISHDTMPWYPSVRLFRQAAPNRWKEVIEQVASALSGLASQPHVIFTPKPQDA